MKTAHDHETATDVGRRAYDEYWARQMADPALRAPHDEEAATMDLWLQLVEARQDAGLTQEQMAERLGVSKARIARIEKHLFEDCPLGLLRRYVKALGDGFVLDITLRRSGQDGTTVASTDRSAAA